MYICIQLYYQQVQTEFALTYPHVALTVKSSIFNLYSKFEATESVTDTLHL